MTATTSFTRRATTLVLAVSVVSATMAGAAAATSYAIVPGAALNSSTSSVSYQLQSPPDGGAEDNEADSGRQSVADLERTITTEDGSASVRTGQSTAVRHGPSAAGYTVRVIRSVAALSGAATRDEATGDDAASRGRAQSTTSFTVNRKLPYAFDNSRVVQTDDTAFDCTRSVVTLKRGDTVVFRRTLQSGGAGCADPAALANEGAAGGELTPGDYVLISRLTGQTTARGDYTVTMRGQMTTRLTLGTGKTCTNVLPDASGGTVVGTSGPDVLCGASGPDDLRGRGGGDLILGGRGDDTISGGAGNDIIEPFNGVDDVSAGDGDDLVRGCDDRRDTLRGQAGSDRVRRDPIDIISGFETKSSC